LYLPIPPVSDSAITAASISGEILDSDTYEYFLRTYPDDRFNPKMRMIYGVWSEGYNNVAIEGTFGFVEADGVSVPPLVKDLCIRLVVWNLDKASDKSSFKEGRIIEEELDDYRYKLDSASSSGSFSDSKIDILLNLFTKKRFRVV